ncbi:ABC transporter substrate-binding protein [Amorphus coralli]|uniref:ABC transporter substrate-binding protein n=1 Tax=Amorphus coralli TaxID=340680 RepID=UPI000371D36C|nr:PhnD/SsuA/transferrin family substrate-binding protein [Amorphus coralli]
MIGTINRRHFLGGSLGLAAAATVPGIGLSPALAAGEPVSWASLQPGFTVLITEFIRHHKLDEKNGFTLAPPQVYTSVPTYYGDFVSGNYDVCIGSWDSFAVRYLGSVPIRYVCSITTGQMINILSKKDGITSIDDIRGKTIAAPQSTGTYRVTLAVLKEFLGIDLEKEATVQNVTNPAASVALLRAGSADAALTWEPNVTNGLYEDDRLQILLNVGDTYTKNTDAKLPYFGVAVRDELLQRDPGIGAKLNGVFKDCINGILGDVDAAVAIVGERTGYKPAVLKEAISSGRLSFAFASMSDESGRAIFDTAAEFFVKNGLLPEVPGSGFLVQS